MKTRRVGWGILAALASLGCPAGKPRQAGSVRNVVLVTIDTLRADRVGAYGSSAQATPHLDRLASRGVVFENAFTTAPLTLPAHASILSGLWPFRHGARVNGADAVSGDAPLLAARLSSAGFATGAVIGSLVLRSGTGLARGFELYDDRFGENAGRPERDWNARRRGDEVVDRALAWLDSVGSRRFFLWVHLYDPHAPYDPTAREAGRFPGRPYEGSVAYADACLGRLLDALSARGLLSETAVAVAADHGESLGEHGETTHGVFLYDATLHVPLVLADPGGRSARRVAEPVSLADLAPTLAEAAGIRAAPADGVSLWPLVSGGSSPPHRVYAESVYPAALLHWSPIFAVRTAQAKYVEAPKPELYELGKDAGERENLFALEHPDARALARELSAIRASAVPARAAAGNGESVSRLTSLGYLTPSGPAGDLSAADSGRTDPKDGIRTWDRIERAIIARQSGRPAEGAALLEEVVVKEAAASPSVLRELAECLRLSGRLVRAIEVYERLVRADAAVADDFFRLGVCWHLLGREDRAALAHERAVALDPSDLDAWIDLGQESLALGRLEASRRAFEAALLLHAASIDALSGLAAVAFERRDDAEAALRLHEALDRAPERVEILENLLQVERRRGNAAEVRRLEERLAPHRARAAVRQPTGKASVFRVGGWKGSKGGRDAPMDTG